MAVTDSIRMSEVQEWFATVKGRQIDVDRVPPSQPFQCVDVAKHYAHWVHGAPWGAYGNGKDVAAGLSRLDGWRFIPASGTPRPGDVMSLGAPYGVDRKTGEVYGHVAVIRRVEGAYAIVAQQDGFNADTVVTEARLPLSAAAGYARPPRYVEEPPAAGSYRVRAGDTLWGLSVRLGTTVARLKALNPGVDPEDLQVGQVLTISGGPSTLTVRAGEGPWTVAQRAGISLAEFYRLNGRGTLHPGDVVKVAR